MSSHYLLAATGLCTLLVAGCGNSLQETVSVRVDQVSCTERVYNNGQASAQVNGNAPYSSTDWGGGVDLNIPLGTSEATKLEQRCKKTLEIAEQSALLQKQTREIELKKEQVELEIKRLELAKRKRLQENETRDIDQEW